MAQVSFSVPPVTNKFSSLLHPRKDISTTQISPVFNKPINTSACPHHRLARILYLISLALLLLMAIPVVLLEALSYSFVEDNRSQGFMFETTERDGAPGVEVVMAALPRMLQQAPAKMALVAAVLTILLSTAHMGFVGFDWNHGKRTQSYAFRRNTMFLHITNSIIILFTLVSIWVTHKNTSHFRDGYVNFVASRMNDTDSTQDFFRYNVGRFDLETWACELKDVRGAAMVSDDYSKQCQIEVAIRALMIPLVVFAGLVAAVGVWGLVAGGRRGPDGERMKTEDVGLEMGKLENAS
ncbi:hypothetical protein T440DRAFT_493157 [Plenodomus tracheiphilus IPT5]|uniref:Uncharacterized protein n=1 Tax=Plenodomus tracheiphilus IPT5 TaxID=1408161 RepID=A0A6A7AR49_9PLEO|nr:hypothetical protein T440DRAFT_493157 [Plenodomus tracheiphilus IPT5]